METATTPALYPTRITHLHRSPVHHYAEHRSYGWYVDVDDLPHLPGWARPFARFEAADHLDGAPGDSLRQRVDAFLARRGVFIPGGRVTALLMPRVLGRAFNPLSLFWCHDAAGAARCVIAEVQTLSGERRAYLLPAGDESPAAVAEGISDAPFAGEDGYFLVRLPRPAEALDLTVSLHRDNHAALVATWRGARRPATLSRVLLLQLTHPLAPQMARLSLRLQELALRWRGLPAAYRPAVRRPVAPQPGRLAQRAVGSPTSGWGAQTHSWATS
ncbi:MAG: DUF1365 family protein [Mycobacterium sp.]